MLTTRPPVALLVLLTVVGSARAEQVHPFTQQLYDEWALQLEKAEAASAPDASVEKAKVALEASDSWFKEKRQTLERHPDYQKGFDRQLRLRASLAKTTANLALFYAERAVAEKRPDYFDAPGGVYQQLARADAVIRSLAEATAPDHALVVDATAHVADLRTKIKAKAAQFTGPGGIAVAPVEGVGLSAKEQKAFATWLAMMEEAEGYLSGADKPLADRVRRLDQSAGWYRDSQKDLKKHPSFGQALERMRSLMLGLAELEARLVVEGMQALLNAAKPKSVDDDLAQRFRKADDLVAEWGGEGKGEQAAQAIAAAKAAAQQLADQINTKAAAAYRLPPEAYAGGDKGKLKQLVLAKWRELYPADQVLGVRFHEATWDRRKETTLNNGTYYHYDTSKLTVYVVVKKSAALGVVYPAYLNKDHRSGELVVGADTKGSTYIHYDVLMQNVKL
jgi:hypothetical protein